jgi:hypothetical protein
MSEDGETEWRAVEGDAEDVGQEEKAAAAPTQEEDEDEEKKEELQHRVQAK